MSNIKNIVISFSGGRTSAFMTKFILENPKYKEFNKIIVFANTGKEHPKTLDFVNKCDEYWGFNTVWLEADVQHEEGVGTKFKIVDYNTASRNGEPFKEVIRKYGIPSKQFPHCTRELKQIPIKKYIQSLGIKNDDFFMAIGIRADERNRINYNTTTWNNVVYPLADEIQVDSKFIRTWFDKQPFDLEIKDYEGNCDLCYKKGKRKRLTLLLENPEIAKWWNDMEIQFGENGKYQFDQREGLTIQQLIEQSKKPFRKSIDKHELDGSQFNLFDDFAPLMDIDEGCTCKSS